MVTSQTTITAKFPILKQGDYDMWKLMIEQYFQVQDYALWDVIKNGNPFKPAAQTTTNVEGTTTTPTPGPVTADEKIRKKNDLKARSMLLMALPNEHLMTFNQYKDAKTLFAAIETRFCSNEATKKTQKTLLKQMNKPDIETMSFDDFYNNFKIVEQKVKGTTNSNSSSNSQNMALVSSLSSTNDVNTAYGVSTDNTQVSYASTQISTASIQVSTANLSDATVYAFFANQPNRSQLVHEDFEQIYEDDLEETDLKSKVEYFNYHKLGHFARECRRSRYQDSRNRNQGSSRRIVNVEDTSSKAILAIDGAGFDWSYMVDDEVPTNMALMAFSEIHNDKTDISYKDSEISMLKSELEKFKQEKESNQLKIEKFDNASKSLDKSIDSQITDNSRKGVGFVSYNVVPPPHAGLFTPPKLDLSNSGLEEFQQPEFEGYRPKTSKSVSEDVSNEIRESPNTQLVKELVSNDKPTSVNTTRPNSAVVNVVRENQVNVVKASACWVWRPTKLNSASITLKRHNYVDARGRSKSVMAWTSRNLIEDMLPLWEEPNEEELLMCDKKNSVLFTGCFVLSPNFKLHDESQILLRVSRKNNIYSVDMKNIVPKESLTCLVANATLDKSMLWHRRLGHNRVLVVKPHNKTPYELFRGRTPSLSFMRPFGCHVTILNTLDYLSKFDGKSNEGFFVGYSLNSDGPKWLFDIDILTESMNYMPVVVGTNSNDSVDGLLFDSSSKNASNDEPQPSSDAGKKDDEGVSKESGIDDQEKTKNSTKDVNTARPSINTASINFNTGSLNINTDSPTVTAVPLEATHADFFADETEVDMSNITTTYPVPSTPNTRIHKDHSLDHVIGDIQSSVQTRRMINEQGFISDVYEGKTHEDLHTCLFACFLSQEEPKKTLVDLPYGKRAIGTKWVYRNKKDERVARIKGIRLFLAYASFKDFVVYQMDVKSAFLYGKIKEEVYVCQPPGFEDPKFTDKYVDEILKKFDISTVKTTSAPMETSKPLLKDTEAEDVDVHLYISMIGSLMYLTASRIIRYLKGQPKLGLWYPKDSLFDLEAYTNSDYAGASLDSKSTTGGCQFLGRRLISWQCKKQTIVANSTTKAKYVAAASCCGQVLWIQNQMLDYGYNFMNTKIFIDNESTIYIVMNLVFHSKTNHIEIRHHFIRDSNEKKLIQMIKIHTNQNVADLLTKAFDVGRF
ncbi:putative ribonuclease H-like domain-containing protein [Tanacetum coccineum]